MIGEERFAGASVQGGVVESASSDIGVFYRYDEVLLTIGRRHVSIAIIPMFLRASESGDFE
jgi:hypothetical protein